ncbi:MAG: HD domain-containing phosphohydrolase [Burkholderiaceae bacterium]
MSATAAATEHNAFRSANPHALAIILQASQTRRIIAATDIFDISGIKLWASRQPVSAELQRKLMDRKLREPLESCLVAEDGVTPVMLAMDLQALVFGDSPLVPLLAPHAERLAQEAAHVPLHPVAQLLFSAAQSARPETYQHAVDAMALAGALAASRSSSHAEVRVAMLCGLLHDLGEMYIDPQHGEADADRDLDFASYQQLVVHPHVGHLIVKQLTAYPAVVSRAVAEHHERLDGSGYPHALAGEAISPMGRLLAVTEASLAATRGSFGHLLRASVALRTVPGEFDLAWVGVVSRAAGAQPALQPVMERAEIQARLGALGSLLAAAERRVGALVPQAQAPTMRSALHLAAFLLQRLRLGWNESGLWSTEAVAQVNAAEVEALEDEIYFRLRAIQRATLLHAGELPQAEAAALHELCDSLAMMG